MEQLPQGASPNSRFLAGEVPHGSVGFAQFRNSAAGSIIAHVGIALLFLFVITLPETVAPNRSSPPHPTLRGSCRRGRGAGVAGAGTRCPTRERTELKGPEKITVPVAPAPKPVLKETPPPQAALTIPAVPTASSVQELPGMITNIPTATASLGSGTGGGSGTGPGTGSGPGSGSGLGPGSAAAPAGERSASAHPGSSRP